MKIIVSVIGRFHAFDLAKQLHDSKHLFLINSTYPKSVTNKWISDKSLIKSNFIIEILKRYFLRFMPFRIRLKFNDLLNYLHAISNIKYFNNDIDFFICWSGSSLESIIEAKKRGITTILERGSSHYNYQMNILKQEFKKNKIDFKCDYYAWKRELLEYELADYISVPSKFVFNTFVSQGISKDKLILNNYGVDLTSFRQIKKNDNTFRVIFAGNFSIRKGVEYLLRAFVELDLHDSELLHIGSLPDETKELRNKFKSNKIKYIGHIPQSNLYKYYSQGSVFVMMSIEEGLAMVQPQAMACGLPLICTKNTGGEDLISADGEEGFVIPIRDVSYLKQKLLYLYNNPKKLKTMGNKARNRVQSGISWKHYGERYIKNLEYIKKRINSD